ncbi:hypothetical protein U1Q18_008412, partial [Sarracenia purpurea var. burkii]
MAEWGTCDGRRRRHRWQQRVRVNDEERWIGTDRVHRRTTWWWGRAGTLIVGETSEQGRLTVRWAEAHSDCVQSAKGWMSDPLDSTRRGRCQRSGGAVESRRGRGGVLEEMAS